MGSVVMRRLGAVSSLWLSSHRGTSFTGHPVWEIHNLKFNGLESGELPFARSGAGAVLTAPIVAAKKCHRNWQEDIKMYEIVGVGVYLLLGVAIAVGIIAVFQKPS